MGTQFTCILQDYQPLALIKIYAEILGFFSLIGVATLGGNTQNQQAHTLVKGSLCQFYS